MKICLLGTGMYGLAIGLELAKKNNEIWMWSENSTLVADWEQNGTLKGLYNDVLPQNVHLTGSYEKALNGAKIVFFVSASKYVDKICDDIKPYFKHSMTVCIATKGIEESTEELLSNIVSEKLLTNNITVISGPTFAVDMLNGNPVALAVASMNKRSENKIIACLANENLKLRPTKDIIGVQLCGAIKNCIAIASGILNGLGYMESTQAFLINESLHDLKELIFYLGGNPKTILSFAGVGDLMLTCMSPKSRNFKFGYTIGHTKNSQKIKEFLLKNTVEGYYTLDVIHKILLRKEVEIPIIDVIYDIVYNEKDPASLAKFLIEKK